MTFLDFLASLGILPPESLQPGRWQRCGTETHPKSKNANVKLCDDLATGFAIDFANMTEASIWRADDDTRPNKAERTAEENAALSARLALRRQEETRGTMRAVSVYEAAQPILHAAHPYLQKKRLDMNGCRGLKVDKDGWLVVPMRRDNHLISIQRISAEGDKRFATGAPTKGCSFRIWRPGAPITILAEGLATGLAVFAACPMAQVIICFSAANLVAVAERDEWSGMVAIAADNDHWTQEIHGKNPGIEAGKRAAEIIGCGVAWPEHIDGTDWHDLYMEKLAMLEKSNPEKDWPDSPHKLRQSALLPIRTALMAVARTCRYRHAG